MKLVLLFVILVSSPFASSQTAGQVRALDKKVKAFFENTNDEYYKNCPEAAKLFSSLSQIVVRDLQYGDYDIVGSTKTHPHVWIELRSNNDSCKFGTFDSSITLPLSGTPYIQTTKEKPTRTLHEDVQQFFKRAKSKACLEAEAVYNKNQLYSKVRDLGNLNYSITGKTGNGGTFLMELANSNGYRCTYKATNVAPTTTIPEARSNEVCGWEYTCGSGYYSGMCANSWVCRRY